MKNRDAAASTSKRLTVFHAFLALLYLSSALIYLYFFYKGSPYYLTPFLERPRLELYPLYKPGGLMGHGFGIVGSAMMLLMLLYSLRKRTRLFSRLGPVSHWLDLHIYLGIFGPLLIILHSSFKVNGLIAVSFYSMLAVALSGILGRFLYLQIPRNVSGHELTLGEIEALDAEMETRLKERYQFTDEMVRDLSLATDVEKLQKSPVIFFFVGLVVDSLRRRISLNKFMRRYKKTHHIPRKELKSILRLARQKSLLHRRILLLKKVQHLFHYWHVVHKPFAIVMIIIMFVHVAVTVFFGYKWIF